jgi:hypothetical protein
MRVVARGAKRLGQHADVCVCGADGILLAAVRTDRFSSNHDARTIARSVMVLLELTMLGAFDRSHLLLPLLHLQGERNAIGNAEFFVYVVQMDLDSSLNEIERVCDLPIR